MTTYKQECMKASQPERKMIQTEKLSLVKVNLYHQKIFHQCLFVHLKNKFFIKVVHKVRETKS